jgi:excisionase family DNA binding protein
MQRRRRPAVIMFNLKHRMLTAAEIAERLKVSIRSVRRWIASGDLQALRLGRSVRVTEDELMRFLGH